MANIGLSLSNQLENESVFRNVSFAFFYTQKRLTLGANQKDHFCEDALVSVSL